MSVHDYVCQELDLSCPSRQHGLSRQVMSVSIQSGYKSETFHEMFLLEWFLRTRSVSENFLLALSWQRKSPSGIKSSECAGSSTADTMMLIRKRWGSVPSQLSVYLNVYTKTWRIFKALSPASDKTVNRSPRSWRWQRSASKRKFVCFHARSMFCFQWSDQSLKISPTTKC